MKLKRNFDIALIMLFLVAISLPSLSLMLGITSQADNNEYRVLAKAPQLSLKQLSTFRKAYQAYFNDNFGLRNYMIRTYGCLKLNYLKSSPDFQRIYGKDGWVFVNPVPKNDLRNWYERIKFTSAELEQITRKLMDEKEQLERDAVPYILVLVPDKESVYSEYYPYPDSIITDFKLNQFIDYLEKYSDLEIINAKDFLKKSKGDLPMWYHSDSHWNNYGAFLTYQQIMLVFSKYNKQLVWPKETDFDIEAEHYDLWVGDLGPYFDWWQKEQDVGVKFKPKKEEVPSHKLNSVIIYGDSYAQTTRFARRSEILKQFPEIQSKLGLFFKNPEGEEDLQPIAKISDLVPLIRDNITGKKNQDRLINYLRNNRVLEEDSVGLNRFLAYSFDEVIFEGYHIPIDFNQIELEKPQLVIREVVSKYLDNWVLLIE